VDTYTTPPKTPALPPSMSPLSRLSSPSLLPTLSLYRMSLIVDNATSLECREYFLSQRLPVTFLPPRTHRSKPAERAVRTGKNYIIAILYSYTHPDFPDDLWDRLLPYAEITLNILRPWRPDPTLSAWSSFHRLPYDFSGQLCLAFSGPEHRDTWTPHGDRAFTLGPALTHYRCQPLRTHYPDPRTIPSVPLPLRRV
jgi:hypothetical protein